MSSFIDDECDVDVDCDPCEQYYTADELSTGGSGWFTRMISNLESKYMKKPKGKKAAKKLKKCSRVVDTDDESTESAAPSVPKKRRVMIDEDEDGVVVKRRKPFVCETDEE